MTAVLRSTGLVVLADVHYPGWPLTVDGQPAEILRTNRAMRGVIDPGGGGGRIQGAPTYIRIKVTATWPRKQTSTSQPGRRGRSW
jgi:hypothetical protein